jgi:signal transduction histidine kinase
VVVRGDRDGDRDLPGVHDADARVDVTKYADLVVYPLFVRAMWRDGFLLRQDARGLIAGLDRDPALVVDGADRVVDVNAAAVAAIGSTEWRGRRLGELVPELAAGSVFERDGRAYDPTVTAVELGGAPARLVVLSDITAARAAVQEREVARAQAEALAAERARLLARVSHEIRTPLHGILGAAELLRGTAGSAVDRAALLEAVASSGHGLLRTVDDVLDLARLEGEHLELVHRDSIRGRPSPRWPRCFGAPSRPRA